MFNFAEKASLQISQWRQTDRQPGHLSNVPP